MHLPEFRLDQRLSDWPDCALELGCCRYSTVLAFSLLIQRHGDRTIGSVLAKLRCGACGKRPVDVYLIERGKGRHYRKGGPPTLAMAWNQKTMLKAPNRRTSSSGR